MIAEKEFLIPASEFRLLLKFMPEWNEPLWIDEKTILDWNTLMPVVEKIGRMNGLADKVERFNVIGMSIATSIHVAHKAVVEFIKWHNSQKK